MTTTETDPEIENGTDEEPRVTGTEADRTEAAQRAQACSDEITEVLQKHNCRISAYFGQPEMVGNKGDRMQLTAVWGIEPLAG